MRRYSLAHLTAINASPPQLVEIAGRCGYQSVGLRLLPVTGGDAFPLIDSAPLRRETRDALAANGVSVLDVELVRLLPETRVDDLRPMIDIAASLGAKHVLTQAHDPDWPRLVDRYAAVCDLAAEYGMTADVEFLTWTDMRTVRNVLDLHAAARRPNAGIVIDTLHFFRSGCEPDDIASIPESALHFIQLADAADTKAKDRDSLIHTAREARLDPGQGMLNLAAVIARLPADLPIAIEIPNSARAMAESDEARARSALVAAKSLVEQCNTQSPAVAS